MPTKKDPSPPISKSAKESKSPKTSKASKTSRTSNASNATIAENLAPSTPLPVFTGPEPLLGVHTSTSGGLATAFDRADKLGINTLQIFVKNNKQWFVNDLLDDEVRQFRERRALWPKAGPIVAHACYLINLGSPKPEIQEKSRSSFIKELTRANVLGVDHFVFHPGAHTGAGEEAAIASIAEGLNWVHEQTPGFTTKSVLEITAGQGSAIGHRFEHLEQIIAKVNDQSRVAVCLDTCHMFASGYDIRTPETWSATFAEFEARVGFDRLVCIHTNDSKKGLGSKVDRHEHIGQGEIGIEGFRLLMNDPRFAKVAKILETPKDDEMTEDYTNLALLKSLIGTATV